MPVGAAAVAAAYIFRLQLMRCQYKSPDVSVGVATWTIQLGGTFVCCERAGMVGTRGARDGQAQDQEQE